MEVYKIVNKTTGKIYIGSTKYTKEERYFNYDWGHIHAMKTNRKGDLYDDMRKYGVGDFELYTLKIVEDYSKLHKYELEMIEYYWDKYGEFMMYNNQRGISSFYKGKTITKEHRENLRKSHEGIKLSEKHKRSKMNHYKLDDIIFEGMDKLLDYLNSINIPTTYDIVYNVCKKKYISKKNKVKYPKLLEIECISVKDRKRCRRGESELS